MHPDSDIKIIATFVVIAVLLVYALFFGTRHRDSRGRKQRKYDPRD